MVDTTPGRDPRDSGSGPTNIYRRKQQRSLPTAGYLFQEKTDVKDIIDPSDMGLKVLQARREGGIANFYSPERYQLQVQELLSAVQAKKEHREPTDLQMWGDSVPQCNT